jgi:hypothetical protein
MAKKAIVTEFGRNQKVKTLEDLPGVPRGTGGRVLLVAGFTWTRYRVAFENGRDIGSIDGSVLCRPKDYEAALAQREEAAAAAEEAGTNGETAEEAAAPSGEDTSVGGVSVPAHLLERSRRARGRVAG